MIEVSKHGVNVHISHKAYEGRVERGVGGGGYGYVGRGRLYTYRYTVTCIKTGRMRAILMFHNSDGQSHKTVSTDHNF